MLEINEWDTGAFSIVIGTKSNIPKTNAKALFVSLILSVEEIIVIVICYPVPTDEHACS